MAFEELRESIKDNIQTKWAEVQESAAFISLREKYDDLTPNAQVFLKAFSAFCGVAFVFWMILGLFSDAAVQTKDFEESKTIIREMLKLKRDMAQAPRAPSPPPADVLKSRADKMVEAFGLAPEQIDEVAKKDFSQDPQSDLIPSSVTQSGVLVSLKKLNLDQVVDIGYRLQGLHTAVKLAGLDMKANSDDKHYYDVMYTMIGYYPPVVENDETEAAAKKRPDRNPRRQPRRGN